ncbi:MAG: RluA family pseudouridine synthase [Oscillospiraceae bacterium]|jgi:23S rRNA pseudouridine1911/1915/1917 synthase|nr:RluA family pseudouridine synthase [Oscillospiraceae bacterium]
MKKEPTKAEYAVTESGELLAFLAAALPQKLRSNAKALLKYRAVLVDGAVVTQYNHKLRRGQTVTILPQGQGGELDGIIYEDDEIIVLNKPEGLLSIATERDKQNTAYHQLTEYVKRRDPRNRIFVVHRLDRDTSGVLIAAKTEKMKLLLQDNWAELVKTRGYTAIAEGKLAEPTGTLRSWLRETQTHVVFESATAGDGLEAITEYRVTRESAAYSMLDIRLQTGRKNQIRVQLRGLGHPVVGDKKYGAATNPMHRLGLHAHLLELEHPVTRKLMSFSAGIPAAFTRLFK